MTGQHARLWSGELRALYLLSLVFGCAMGLFNPLVSAYMEQHGADSIWIGAVSSIFFTGVALGAPLAQRVVRRRGARFAMVAGLGLAALTGAAFPFSESLISWCTMRALAGIGIGMTMVAGQSRLNACAAESARVTINSLYALAFGIGMGIGPLIGTGLYRTSASAAFACGAVMLGLGALLGWRCIGAAPGGARKPDSRLLKRLALPLHGAFAYGFAEAVLMSLYPVFLLRHGYTLEQVGYAFSAFVVGALVATLPLALAADRYGSARILFCCAFVGACSTLALALVDLRALTFVCALLAGASLGPVFAISLAMIGNVVATEELPSGTALFTASFSIGAAVAPVFAAAAMNAWGDGQVFSIVIVLFAGLALRLAIRLGRGECRSGAVLERLS